MENKVNCIMLIDDNANDNFFHERIIKKTASANIVIARQTGFSALQYLKPQKGDSYTHPDLIFLDINMPGMNGWEFLDEYNKLDQQLQSLVIIVMLTTSENPDDLMKAKLIHNISEFKTKPLTKEVLEEILEKYFHQ